VAIMYGRWPSGLPDTELGGRLSRCVNKSIKPWNKIVEPDPLRALLVECGVTDPVVVLERIRSILPRIGGRSFSVRGIGQQLTLFLLPIGRESGWRLSKQ
jgi:hypothetical protein